MSGTGYTTGGPNGLPYRERLRTDRRLRTAYDVVVLEGGADDAHHGSLTHLPDAALAIVDLARRTQQVTSERGLPYVSQLGYADITDAGFLSADRFHPGDAGYRRMGWDLVAALRR